MTPISGPEFYSRTKGSPIFKEDDTEVIIYVYINSTCFRYFTISTKDSVWETPNDLFERLSGGKEETNTFLYFFINSKTKDLIEEENINTSMKKLSI